MSGRSAIKKIKQKKYLMAAFAVLLILAGTVLVEANLQRVWCDGQGGYQYEMHLNGVLIDLRMVESGFLVFPSA